MESQKCEKFSKSSKLTKSNSVRTPSFLMPKKKKSPWLRQYQSYISNWYVNGKVFTSTTTWEPKNLFFFFFQESSKLNSTCILTCWRVEIIQVGVNMHLYVDIGDASSSLWGSTSSFYFLFVKCSCRVSMIGMFVVWHHYPTLVQNSNFVQKTKGIHGKGRNFSFLII